MSADATHVETPRSAPGKRRAVKPARTARVAAPTKPVPHRGHAGGRKSLFPHMPSVTTAMGAAALVMAATGAVTVGDSPLAKPTPSNEIAKLTAASVLSGTSRVQSTETVDDRERAVSRDSQREALQDAAEEELQAAAEAQAKERNAALQALAASAEQHADEIAANLWVLPLSSYDLSAGFGESSSLWSSTHTGLDFAASYGAPIMSVANGVVTSTGYDGSYGNKTVVTLEDGTEIWYCHQSEYAVSPGDAVSGGEVLGYVGSTGNSTGSHLHLEVRPGAGDPVDPYAALAARGLTP